ncbi:hypothetical protein [Pseudogemmobacter sonorensis]|uniref:hypothetical protein n=1 Tax=Pseudogemmobacter sonorensis TaxID=2989681 RepID=UPI0036946E67
MADTDNLIISTREIMTGMVLHLRMPRSFTIRTKLACWLIGLAGRIMTVPCEIEMRDDALRTGDVVRDRFDGKQMVVLAGVENGYVRCARCRDGVSGSFPRRSLVRADLQDIEAFAD